MNKVKVIPLRNLLKTVYFYGISYLDKKSFSNLELYITSHGGVGTSFFIDYLSKFKKTNEAFDMTNDLTKHLPVPPQRMPRDLRIIYVFGDPVLATTSLFRRKYAHLATCRIGSFGYISESNDLAQYIELGQDSLGLNNHFKRWLNQRWLNRQTLFINYDKLWDYKNVIASFSGIPLEQFGDFPDKKQRKSNTLQLTPSQVSKLENIYKSYYDLMDKIGDYKILIPK